MRKWFAMLAGLSVFAAAPAFSQNAACAASLAALRYWVSDIHGPRPWLEDQVSPFVPYAAEALAGDAEHPQGRWAVVNARPGLVTPPSRALVEAFLRDDHISAASCPDIKAFTYKAGVRTGRARYPTPQDSHGAYPYAYLQLSRAAVSSDGKTALVYASIAMATLSGGADILLLRRAEDGSWTVEAVFSLGVA